MSQKLSSFSLSHSQTLRLKSLRQSIYLWWWYTGKQWWYKKTREEPVRGHTEGDTTKKKKKASWGKLSPNYYKRNKTSSVITSKLQPNFAPTFQTIQTQVKSTSNQHTCTTLQQISVIFSSLFQQKRERERESFLLIAESIFSFQILTTTTTESAESLQKVKKLKR